MTTTDNQTAAAFLVDIIAHPADDTPRLIFADWLEEHGEPERAEFIRVQIRLWHCRDGVESCPPVEPRCGRCMGCVLRDRALELLTPYNRDIEWFDPPVPSSVWSAFPQIQYSRGFVSAITCTTVDWLAHGPAIVRAQPVERVALSDKGAYPPGGRERCAWFHPQVPSAGELSGLPLELFDLVIGCNGSVPRCKWFDSRVEALAAISSACLAWAKVQVS